MKKNKTKYKILSGFLSILLLCGCATSTTNKTETPSNTSPNISVNKTAETPQANTPVEGQMKIHCIDVGQGDSTLIHVGTKNILIDAGENEKGPTVKKYLTNLGVKTIDVLIGTHPHSDHIGGLDLIIDSFDIGKVYLPNKMHTSKTFKDVLASLEKKNLKFEVPNIGDEIKFPDTNASLIFMGPSATKDYGKNLNAYSLVTMINFGDVKYLTGGDCDYDAYDDLLSSGRNLDSTIFHTFHHGSANHTNTTTLKNKVTPQYTIISSGAGNSYGHPHKETLGLFSDNNVYRTDTNGTIVVTIASDATIEFATEKTAQPEVTKKQESQTPANSNSDSDNQVFIGNKNTKKYHRSNCSKLPMEKNRVQFASEQETKEAGYVSSKECITK